MEWTESLKRAVNYIEKHLLDDISIEDIAADVYMSPFYFQKGFGIMTGYSVGEYIRMRRLYLSALDAVQSREKVIDLAFKYGYSTPESFTRAFCRFHGVAPQQIRGDVAKIKVFLPLKITVNIQGGNEMDYTVEKMDKIQLIAFEKVFDFETAYKEIPAFWDEVFARMASSGGTCDGKCIVSEFGVCIDDNPESGKFTYLIAGRYDGGVVPEGMRVFTLPGATWAKFSSFGPLPGALQTINTKIFKEWLPGNPDYELDGDINVEWYSMGDMSSSWYESAIWIPVKKK
ncbi:MAG: AraC family transcriptional regulator [Clostridiaceae bacterium]|nr:AraC family transcriptional regulator [Clostridiaceae bacterium]